jgi:cysteine desulfurase
VTDAASLYLDYAATTPVDAAVAQVMSECLTLSGAFGNPSSAHAFGAAAARRVAAARAQVAALINASADEIIFTSGATEANNLAILGVCRAQADRGRHLVTVRTEHKAVLDPCRHLERTGAVVTYLSPDSGGRITVAQLASALRADTVLVSVMYANNETGVLQDVPGLAGLCRERGVAFHTDCAQAAPRMALDVRALAVDLMSFTAHKLYGPKGIGALYVRGGARGLLQPLLFGGGQERGLRPGTLPVHQIAGFGAACDLIRQQRDSEPERLEGLARRLWAGLEPLGDLYLNGATAPRVPGILNVSFGGVEGESLFGGLAGLAVSAGAACNSEVREPSYVLRALGRDARLAESSLRFSLGRFSTEAEVDAAIGAVTGAVRRLRRLSPRAPEPSSDAQWAAPGSRRVSGEAGAEAQGTWVRFHLLVDDDAVKDARFQAFACPHTVDTAAWLCERLRGRRRLDLQAGTPAEWAAARSVPVEKLGRLLVVEDALNDCITRWT